MAIKVAWLLSLLAITAGPVTAQPVNYTPIQPGHADAVWYDPGRSGEGLTLALIPTDAGHTVFAALFLHEPTAWLVAQRDRNEAWTDVCPDDWPACYEIPLLLSPGVDQSASVIGSLWLRPGGGGIDWVLVADTEPPIVRRAKLYPIGKVRVGVCARLPGFSPLPPSAGEWCHDQ